jgi:hypothetical protein
VRRRKPTTFAVYPSLELRGSAQEVSIKEWTAVQCNSAGDVASAQASLELAYVRPHGRIEAQRIGSNDGR